MPPASSFPADRFLALHRLLALIPGPSNHEEPRRRALEQHLQARGVRTTTDAVGNLWVSLGQGAWEDTVVLDAHLDVVERGSARKVVRDDEAIRGLGVGDDLVAVTMLALLAERLTPRQDSLRRPLALLFSVGEEGLGNLRGVRQAVADHPTPPWAFLSLDGSMERYSTVGLGSLRYRLRVACPGGHSWGNYGSPNAIDQLVDVIEQLRVSHRKVADSVAAPLTWNVGTIAGGQGINSIARAAEATLECRSTSPQALAKVDREFSKALRPIRSRESVSVSRRIIGRRPAAQAVMPERLEPTVLAVLGEAGIDPEAVPASTNINVPLAAGWPALCMGVCTCGNSHREDEFVLLNSLPRGWQCLSRITEALLL